MTKNTLYSHIKFD